MAYDAVNIQMRCLTTRRLPGFIRHNECLNSSNKPPQPPSTVTHCLRSQIDRINYKSEEELPRLEESRETVGREGREERRGEGEGRKKLKATKKKKEKATEKQTGSDGVAPIDSDFRFEYLLKRW